MVAEISEIVAQMHDVSTTLANAAEEQTATTREIARNVTEAAVAESQATENTTSVAPAAQRTSIGTQSTQSAARELSRMANELQGLVGQFKCANGSGISAPLPGGEL